MKIKRALILSLILLLISSPIFSQQKDFIIKLTIVDSLKNEPIEFATASLTSPGANKALKYGLSNQKGKVEITGLQSGNYILKIEYMGYKSVTKSIVITNQKITDFGNIAIQEQINSLNSVVVSAVGNPIVVKKDTIEYNASSFKTTDSDMLETLLKKLPGIEIDSDGKITSNGKEINKIMIDGKVFFLNDPQLATKNLPAKIVDKVRVVERKSDQARFTGIDDGNEETIIDLGIKPGMMNGWFGNMSAGYGTEDRYQTAGLLGNFTSKSQFSAIINGNNTNNRGFSDMAGDMMRSMRGSMRGSGGGGGRGGAFGMGGNGITNSWMAGTNFNTESANKKLKIGGSYLFTDNDNVTQSKSSRQTFIQDSSFIYKQGDTSNSVSKGHRVALQLEYAFSDNTSIIFRPNANFGIGSFNESKVFSAKGVKGTNINDGYSKSYGDNNSQSLDGELLFRQKLGKPGRTFSVNFNYSYSNNETDGTNKSQTNVYKPFSKTTNIDQQYNFNSLAYSLGARASYTEPIGKDYFMELAYSYRYRLTNSDKNTYNYNEFTQRYDMIDNEYSNSFENTFINQQAEINLRKVGEKYNYVIGFSAQPAYTESIGDTTSLSRNVLNFSPSAMFDFKFSESQSMRARYRGNTRQPSINQLQPVPDNSNPLYRPIGNPDLAPEFEHNVSVEYRDTKRETFRTYEARFSATYTVDKIVNKSWYDQGGVQYTMPVNEQGVFSTSGNFMYSTPLNKSKLFISTNTRLGFNKGVNYSNGLRNNTTSFSTAEQLKFIYKGSKFETSIGTNITYNNAWYTIQQKSKSATWTNALVASVNWTLPAGLNIVSDFDYRFYVGFDQATNKPSAVWNAEISKLLLKESATFRVKIYDILNQSKNIYRNTTDNYVEDIENNILKQYIMFSFTYRFGKFTGGGDKGRYDGPGGHRGMGDSRYH